MTHRARHQRFESSVRLLEVDPDLAAGLDPEQERLAASRTVVRVMSIERGPWRFRPDRDGGLGAIVLDGMILVRVGFAGIRGHVELLGEGDVISPWVGMGSSVSVPCEVTAQVVAKVRVALLDHAFALRTARWPEIHAALMQRLLIRSRLLSMQSAINSLPRIEERLEITLWQLAYRFGRVSTDGIRLHLPITQSQLAEMVNAQRPSVTTAIARMRDQGRLAIPARHDWVLCGEPPARLVAVVENAAAGEAAAGP